MEDEPEIYLNDERINSPDELSERLYEWQDAQIAEQDELMDELGVTDETAAAIQYLRTRSRWTQEKEDKLIRRDLEGNPIPLMRVLSGDF